MQLQVVPNKECEVPDYNMCTVGRVKNVPNDKDIGGALVINEYGKWTQIGVYAFITQIGDRWEGGFIRLSGHVNWISRKIAAFRGGWC